MPNTYLCSSGERVTQTQINSRLAKAKKGSFRNYGCECLGPKHYADDCDHSISQKRCKELKKTELIWTEANWSWSSRKAHEEWESYKNGRFQHHKNFKKRMRFVATHDYNVFMARFHYVTDPELIKWCETLMFDESDILF